MCFLIICISFGKILFKISSSFKKIGFLCFIIIVGELYILGTVLSVVFLGV